MYVRMYVLCIQITMYVNSIIRYHLQALRHLYVLAAEHRVLVTVDNDSGKTCSVPVCVKTSSGELTAMSPCIVPSWEDITEVSYSYTPVQVQCLSYHPSPRQSRGHG